MSIPAEALALAQAHGVALEGALAEKLAAYLDLLLATNAEFNLTAVTHREEAWTRHIADSLSLAPELRTFAEDAQAIDVGSGGGLPGIPLAIAFPRMRFTLLESTGKKAHFLEETAKKLALGNVRVVSERAETFAQGKGRERFDVATSRAVSRLPVLLELTLPFVRVGGASLAIKGEQAQAEVDESKRALALLFGVVSRVQRTPTGTVVRVDKTHATPARYPRRNGEPKRHPL